MAGRRSYADSCGIARALDVVGERWALLVVRELLLGPKRYTDLQAGLPAVSPDVLAQRLRDLEAAGVLRRATLPPPAASKVYELTARGRELEPVLLALGRWGSREPLRPAHRPLGVDALLVALPTLLAADRAGGEALTIELRLDGRPCAATVRDGALAVARGAPERSDAVIEASPGTLAQVLWHGRPLDAGVRIDGDRAAAERFLALFPAPVPAGR